MLPQLWSPTEIHYFTTGFDSLLMYIFVSLLVVAPAL